MGSEMCIRDRTMAKRINMTPARYEKLWLNLEQKQLNSAEVIEAEVVND